jgi:hypothetical protein
LIRGIKETESQFGRPETGRTTVVNGVYTNYRVVGENVDISTITDRIATGKAA